MANLRVDKITSTETFETTGSVQFDGSGDYLYVSGTNQDFAYGTGDFTVEFWINTSNWNIVPFDTRPSGTNGDYFTLYIDVDGALTWYEGGAIKIQGSDGVIVQNTWVHIAATRKGTSAKLFVNGVQTGPTFTDNTDYVTTANRPFIGSQSRSGGSSAVNGYLSNFRVIKGTALYTSNFKPPMRELEVTAETVLLVCQSKTDASLEKTGKTITVNGNAVANELTPGILTPIVKSGGGSAITGSVEFDGSGDHLLVSSSSDFGYGSNDFTIEFWWHRTSTDRVALFHGSWGQDWSIGIDFNGASNQKLGFWASSNGTSWDMLIADSGGNGISTGIPDLNSWSHIAYVRYGNIFRGYLNGIKILEVTNSSSINSKTTTREQAIGAWWNSETAMSDLHGFLSNFRIVKGTALYTDDFIPPTRELKKVPGTVLLCCQDENSVTTEVTGKTITSNGDPAASNFTPQVGDDRQVTFEGVTKINSDAYFYLPTGDTITRDSRSGRGVFGVDITIDYITIATTGNASDFGDLTEDRSQLAACSSSIRGVFGGGDPGPSVANTIDFITISSTGNAFDFGDLIEARRRLSALSSSTRGVFGGGQTPTAVNTIDFITIASTGDAVDFGDLIGINRELAACSSSTRGVFGGGGDSPANVNIIQFITISSTGDTSDFGDLSQTRSLFDACSNSVRGVFGGGQPGFLNTIDYITIASTGNAQDFGDLTQARLGLAACSSSTHGVFGGGLTPTAVNTIDFITIASTGNAVDFGDFPSTRNLLAACSNGHGGLG